MGPAVTGGSLPGSPPGRAWAGLGRGSAHHGWAPAAHSCVPGHRPLLPRRRGLRPKAASEVTPGGKEVADRLPTTPPRSCHRGTEAHTALPASRPQWAPGGSGSAPGKRTDLPRPGRGFTACEPDLAGPRDPALNPGEADLLAPGPGPERRDRGSPPHPLRCVCRNGDQGGGCKFRQELPLSCPSHSLRDFLSRGLESCAPFSRGAAAL